MKRHILILLIIFTAFAVLINFLPHLNYSYPLHVDEWVHFQYSNHLSSQAPQYLGENRYSLEGGFHFLLATLNSIGVPYTFMFTFFASFFVVLICLSIFILTRQVFNETAAVFAVLFIALLQSTVMILGPVFFVPLTIGLLFIPIILYLIKVDSKIWVLFFASVLVIHPPTATALFLLMNIEFFVIRKNYLKNLFWQLVSLIIAFPFYIPYLLAHGTDSINALSFTVFEGVIFIPKFLGYITALLVAIGIFTSVEKKKYSFTLYSLVLLIFILAFYHLRIDLFIPYRRALMYLFIVFSVLFGVGCSYLVEISKKRIYRIMIFVVLVGLILLNLLPAKFESNRYFYHVIDEKDSLAFDYIKQNTPKDAIVLADPWKSNAITPLAERQVYSRVVQGPNKIVESKNQKAYAFFENGCRDTIFLEENNISVVYGVCQSDNLREVYSNVYLLEDS